MKMLMPRSAVEAAAHHDPYPFYADLVRNRPFAYDTAFGLWVAAGAAAVEEALSSSNLGVRPPDESVPMALTGTTTGEVFGRLIRMNDGNLHSSSRPTVAAALAGVEPGDISAAAGEVADHLLDRTAGLDRFVMAYPVGVVALLLGLPPAELDGIIEAVDEFVAAVRPGSDELERERGDAATALLRQRLSAIIRARTAPPLAELNEGLEAPAALANAIGLLMQSYEAAAGLLGNALVRLRELALAGDAPPVAGAAFVREVARHDAPVQNTRRFALRDCRICGHELRRGDSVLVVLAAANRDPAANPEPASFLPGRESAKLYTFGLGAHHCPGAQIATPITVEGLAWLAHRGIAGDMIPPAIGYRPSSNVRIPRFDA